MVAHLPLGPHIGSKIAIAIIIQLLFTDHLSDALQTLDTINEVRSAMQTGSLV